MFPSLYFTMDVKNQNDVFVTPMVVKGQPLDYTYKLTFASGQALKDFVEIATNDRFIPGKMRPDSEPRYTGKSDGSITSEGSYDEDELKFFRKTEASINWN